MPYFDNEGIKIYHEIEGNGPDLIMVHGFAANIEVNWKNTNWIKTLKDEYRMILIDCRGHGKSDKPTDPAQYGAKMTEDVIKLMDYLSIDKSNFIGYSMGGRITLNILLNEPHRFKSAILGGYVPSPSIQKQRMQFYEPIIKAFEVGDIEKISNPVAKEFLRFARSTGADFKALAAVMRGQFNVVDDTFTSRARIRLKFKKIRVPVLTVVGSNDFLITDKSLIAELLPNACHFQIQGRDHLTVVPDPKFHMVVKAFLSHVNKK